VVSSNSPPSAASQWHTATAPSTSCPTSSPVPETSPMHLFSPAQFHTQTCVAHKHTRCNAAAVARLLRSFDPHAPCELDAVTHKPLQVLPESTVWHQSPIPELCVRRRRTPASVDCGAGNAVHAHGQQHYHAELHAKCAVGHALAEWLGPVVTSVDIKRDVCLPRARCSTEGVPIIYPQDPASTVSLSRPPTR
jgi:hypothetical protein